MAQAMQIKSANMFRDCPIENTRIKKNKKALSFNDTIKKDSIYSYILYNKEIWDAETYKNRLNNLKRLEDMRHLEDDWDGYKAKSIPSIVIDNGEKFIKNISKQPSVYPTGRRSIHMQYDLDDRSYLEFEIFEDKITCMKVPKRIYDQATFETFSYVDMDKFNQIVEGFYEEHNKSK